MKTAHLGRKQVPHCRSLGLWWLPLPGYWPFIGRRKPYTQIHLLLMRSCWLLDFERATCIKTIDNRWCDILANGRHMATFFQSWRQHPADKQTNRRERATWKACAMNEQGQAKIKSTAGCHVWSGTCLVTITPQPQVSDHPRRLEKKSADFVSSRHF